VSQSDRTATGGRFGGRRWLIVIPVVVLLLGGIAWVVSGSDDATPKPDTGTAAPTAVPDVGVTQTSEPSAASPTRLGVNRDGNAVTITGDVPDDATRSELVSAVKSQWAAADVTDHATVVPGARVPDLSGLGGVLSDADGVGDLGLNVSGSDLTITGTVPDLDIASRIQASAKLAFPNLKLTNNIQILATGAPPMDTPGPATANAPTPGCSTLQADIVNLLRTPIGFTSGGAQMTSESKPLVAKIAAKVAACPAASISVVGYTDNVGGEAVNQQLSAGRAKAVADALVANGVAPDHVSSRGAGSADPIASNDTPAGRAQNRRVAIAVN